jgi:TusE/DsrC/DsvC family sulfur relay protein
MKEAEERIGFNGKQASDEEGFLIDPADWSEDVGRTMCEKDGLHLTNNHWEIILFMRTYYSQYRIEPMPRVIIKELNKKRGAEKYSIKKLYNLFPDTPVRLLCKYAGIPKFARCT